MPSINQHNFPRRPVKEGFRVSKRPSRQASPMVPSLLARGLATQQIHTQSNNLPESFAPRPFDAPFVVPPTLVGNTSSSSASSSLESSGYFSTPDGEMYWYPFSLKVYTPGMGNVSVPPPPSYNNYGNYNNNANPHNNAQDFYGNHFQAPQAGIHLQDGLAHQQDGFLFQQHGFPLQQDDFPLQSCEAGLANTAPYYSDDSASGQSVASSYDFTPPAVQYGHAQTGLPLGYSYGSPFVPASLSSSATGQESVTHSQSSTPRDTDAEPETPEDAGPGADVAQQHTRKPSEVELVGVGLFHDEASTSSCPSSTSTARKSLVLEEGWQPAGNEITTPTADPSTTSVCSTQESDFTMEDFAHPEAPWIYGNGYDFGMALAAGDFDVSNEDDESTIIREAIQYSPY